MSSSFVHLNGQEVVLQHEVDPGTGSDIGVIPLLSDDETEDEAQETSAVMTELGPGPDSGEEDDSRRGHGGRRQEPRANRIPRPARRVPQQRAQPLNEDPECQRSAGYWNAFKMILIFALASFVLGEVYYQWYMVETNTCGITTEDQVARWGRLQTELKEEVFGQHIAIEGTLRSLYAHMTDPNPKKALVLCFHGWLGSGKTYVSHLIAKHLFAGGLKSPHVKSFVGPRHFVLDSKKLHENQEKLVKTIEDTVKSCERSLFIFDEVDKMPAAIFNALVTFIGHQGPIDGVDYGRATFIFLSNTGGDKINDLTLTYLNDGKQRSELSLYDYRQTVADGAFNEEAASESLFTPPPAVREYFKSISTFFNEFQAPPSVELLKEAVVKSTAWEALRNSIPAFIFSEKEVTNQGGLFQSEMITKRLVDQYIPFLPLEKNHVILCAKREMKRRNVLYIDPLKIANRVIYFPAERPIFAEDGCKNIMSHVAYYVHDSDDIFKDEF